MKNIIRQSSPFLLRKRDSQYHNITRDFRKCIVPGFQRKSSKIFKESLLKGSTTIAPEKKYPPPPTLTLKRTLTLTLTGGGGNFPWRQLSYNCPDARVKNCSMKRLFRSSTFATLESKFQKGKVGTQYLQTFFNIFFLVSFSNQSTCFILASRSSLLISEAY